MSSHRNTTGTILTLLLLFAMGLLVASCSSQQEKEGTLTPFLSPGSPSPSLSVSTPVPGFRDEIPNAPALDIAPLIPITEQQAVDISLSLIPASQQRVVTASASLVGEFWVVTIVGLDQPYYVQRVGYVNLVNKPNVSARIYTVHPTTGEVIHIQDVKSGQ